MMENTKTNNYVPQVGGDHYQGKIKPWDLMAKYNMNWFQGEVFKYAYRFRRKDTPKMNLEKAISVCKKANLSGINGLKKAPIFDDIEFLLQYVEDYTLVKPGDMLPTLYRISNCILKGEWISIIKDLELLLEVYGNQDA